MQIHNVKRNTQRKKSVQVGRGGKRGKTSGRGHKGQKQHGGHGMRPHMRDVIKKLPKLRGHGKNSNPSVKTKPQPVNVATLESSFKEGERVTPDILLAKKLLRQSGGKIPTVKILGTGDITKKLTIEECFVSETAMKKITAVGGTIVAIEDKIVVKNKGGALAQSLEEARSKKEA